MLALDLAKHLLILKKLLNLTKHFVIFVRKKFKLLANVTYSTGS